MEISELKAELERLHGASFGWALNCCRHDRAEAEEVLQTVYLKILEGKARYRGDSSLKTWLFAVIRNTAITEQRRSLLRRLKFNRPSEPAAWAKLVDWGAGGRVGKVGRAKAVS